MFTHTLVDVPLPADPGFPYGRPPFFDWQKGVCRKRNSLLRILSPRTGHPHLTRLHLTVSETMAHPRPGTATRRRVIRGGMWESPRTAAPPPRCCRRRAWPPAWSGPTCS